MSSMKDPKKERSSRTSAAERAAVQELVRAARGRGEDITGPDGLLKSITATVLESALEEELTNHLGHPKHQAPTGGADKIRNGTRSKTVLTDAAGEVTIAVPRDRAGTFDPVIVRKRQRRLTDVDAVAISLYAKGLTTGAISAHFAEVYGASIGKDTISRITDRVVEEMQAWTSRPLTPVYAAGFIDAIYVKVRDGQVGNRPFYAAIGVDLNGRRDVLGLWAGTGGGESAKFWMNVLTDLKNRGVRDVFFVVCDGVKGLPDAVNTVFRCGCDRASVRHPSDPGHPPLRLAPVLGPAREGPARHLHRPHRRGGLGRVRGAGGQVGQALPRDPEDVASRVGEVHTLPRLRRRDQAGPVQHQRDRVAARAVPPRSHRPRTLLGVSDERCFRRSSSEFLRRRHAVGEGHGECVQGGLPPRHPACLTGALRVESSGDQVQAFQCGLLGGEVSADGDRAPVPGVQRLDRVGAEQDPANLDV